MACMHLPNFLPICAWDCVRLTPCGLSFLLFRPPLKQVLHFSSSPKPWEEAKRKGDLEMLWWQHFVSLQLQGLHA